MSRRIGDDFDAFYRFLQEYSLRSVDSKIQNTDLFKPMHRKLYGFLVFTEEFKVQNIFPDCKPFLNETASDLLLALFCAAQGMYKPAKLQLRCSIENFLKCLLLITDPNIVSCKNVFSIFDTAKQDKHFITQLGSASFDLIHNNYSDLCRTVHGDPSVMNPISAVSLFPNFDPILQREFSDTYIKTIESFLSVFYLNYPEVIDRMHPENKKDFLDCISKKAKGGIIATLYSE